MAGKYVDTRAEINAPNFDGSDSGWDAWKVNFGACLDLTEIGDYADEIAGLATPVVQAYLGACALPASKAIFDIVVSKCEGNAFSLIMLQARREGLEAWRQVTSEYEGTSGSRVAAMLRGILNLRRGGNAFLKRGRTSSRSWQLGSAV